MEYISLHRYIRHTPPDTEDLAKHQLRVSGSPDYGKRKKMRPALYRNRSPLMR